MFINREGTNMRKQKVVTVVTGAGTLATSLATNLLVGGSAVAAATPSCDASATTAQSNAKVTTANAGLSSAFLATSGKALHADTVKKEATYKKAKGAAKSTALKAWNAAKAKEAAALAAYKKLNTFSIFTSAATAGDPVTRAGRDGVWTWGDYKTQLVIKGGKLVGICANVDESNAGNNLGDKATTEDAETSKNTYQGIGIWDAPIPGYLEVLFRAAKFSPATSAAKISQNVQTCITNDYETITSLCPKGGLAFPGSPLTGATYTVETFKKSLADVLGKAKTAKAIAN